MWTVFVGIALGFLEMHLLRKNVEIMSRNRANVSLGVLITLAKFAVVLVLLYVIAKYLSLNAMLWCAGGLAGTMIALPIFFGVTAIRRDRRQREAEK